MQLVIFAATAHVVVTLLAFGCVRFAARTMTSTPTKVNFELQVQQMSADTLL
jgi:hypothetical protein